MSRHTYKDGEHRPHLAIYSSNQRPPVNASIFVVRTEYTRSYKDGNTAVRYAGEVWIDGESRPDDLDSRSVFLMYPRKVRESIVPVEHEEDK